MEVTKMEQDKSQKENICSEEIKQAYKDMDDLHQAASALFIIPVFFSHQNLISLGLQQPPFTMEQQFIIRMFKEIKKGTAFPKNIA